MAWTIKTGDTDPPIPATLSDERGPAPLTGATVRFLMAQVDGDKSVIGDGTVTDADAGKVEYRWRSDGTDTNVAGVFRAEWEVTWAEGTEDERVETFPSDGYVDVVIRPQIA